MTTHVMVTLRMEELVEALPVKMSSRITLSLCLQVINKKTGSRELRGLKDQLA